MLNQFYRFEIIWAKAYFDVATLSHGYSDFSEHGQFIHIYGFQLPSALAGG
jgi:hypothetical protein